jgi:hypothetical protein
VDKPEDDKKESNNSSAGKSSRIVLLDYEFEVNEKRMLGIIRLPVICKLFCLKNFETWVKICLVV